MPLVIDPPNESACLRLIQFRSSSKTRVDASRAEKAPLPPALASAVAQQPLPMFRKYPAWSPKLLPPKSEGASSGEKYVAPPDPPPWNVLTTLGPNVER